MLHGAANTLSGRDGSGLVLLAHGPLGSLPVLHFIAELLRAAPLLGHRWRRFVKRTMAGGSVAVVCSGVVLGTAIRPAGADPIGATRDQISATRAQIQAGAAQVHALTVAFQQANLEAGTLAQQVGVDQDQIAQLQGQLSGSERILRRQALLSYTGGASSNLDVRMASTDPSVGVEYLQVATGDLNDAVDQLRTQQGQLASVEATLARQEQQSEVAAASAAQARQQALAAATAEQDRLDQLQTQLNQYIEAAAVAAQRQAAQAAQAASAQAARVASAQAARAAAARAAAATPTPVAPTQGLPVNGGLVSAVNSIVSTPAPAPAPAPSPPASSGGGAGGVWLQLRECESGDNYAENTGNGFYGAYQFSEQTWAGLGYPGRPDLEPPAMQDQAAMKLQAEAGWAPWPACSVALGLR